MIGNALKKLRKNKGLTQAQLAEILGLSTTAVNEYEADKKNPLLEGLVAVADYFSVSPNFLLGVSDVMAPPARTIPVLGVIRAGLPILAEENWDEQITVGQFENGADFGLRVTGDSMVYAGIRPGDIVLMQRTERAASGQIVAAVLQDGDAMATLKYFVDDGWQPVLRAANPKYADQVITSAHRIVGVYTGLVRTDEPSLRECEDLIALAESLDENWKKAMAELTGAGWGPKDIVDLISVMRRLKK